ncbi:MAG: hypothetical protein M3132_15365 [Actinomycetia bacterium]|nr:hypothetical protein [Actinomycetes bacterium]
MANPLARIHGLNAQIDGVGVAIDQAIAERDMLTHIDDDAQRDAAVTGRYEDRVDAKHTARDVRRIDGYVETLRNERTRLIRKRDRLVTRLAAG